MSLKGDFLEFLDVLHEADVAFMIVGAHALAIHDVPRATGDIDIWVRPSEENAAKVIHALKLFGAPIQAHGVTEEYFSKPGRVYQIGLPPIRIDILTSISGIEFDEAWPNRIVMEIEDRQLKFISKADIITNKRASGRDKDLLDVKRLLATNKD